MITSTVSPEEIARLKGLGFLRDKTTPDCFNARVITVNGKITAAKAADIAEAAARFGSGELAMTSRMTIEVQRIPYDKIEDFCAFLAEHGLETGGTGPRVRPIVSCKGTTCHFGLIDTFALSEAIHERFYKGYHETKLPHKFKIAVGGCPNNCVKPDINDIGIIGQRVPRVDDALCKGCKICQVEKCCPMKAASLSASKIAIDPAICNHCGRCAEKCPFGAVTHPESGYRIYIGGRWGKKCARGIPLSKIFRSEEEVLAVIERAICFFRDHGIAGERFAETIERIGFENVEKELIG